MTVKTQGSCLCGKTTFTINHEDDYTPNTMFCHCQDCQILSGGFGTLNIAFPIDSISWSGAKKALPWAGDSGNVNDKIFCGECGSTMATMAKKRSLAIIKTPCIRDAAEKYKVAPNYEQFIKSKYAFEPKTYHEGAQQFEEMKK